jgi:hypothetical protein
MEDRGCGRVAAIPFVSSGVLFVMAISHEMINNITAVVLLDITILFLKNKNGDYVAS